MLRNEADRLKRVIVCTPKRAYSETFDSEKHNLAELADCRLAVSQHDSLKSSLADFGSEVVDVSELDSHPNSVFTRDTALCTPNGYVKLRLGLPSREGEGEWMANNLDALEENLVGEIVAPGTVEGGDVLLAGSTAFVGKSKRTNDEGIKQLSSILEKMDYTVRVVSLPDNILHLDKILTVIGRELLLRCNEFVSDSLVDGFSTVDIGYDGKTNANVICLGESEVIIDRSNQGAINALLANEVTTHVLDFSEFAKGNGGPNCLVLPVDRWN